MKLRSSLNSIVLADFESVDLSNWCRLTSWSQSGPASYLLAWLIYWIQHNILYILLLRSSTKIYANVDVLVHKIIMILDIIHVLKEINKFFKRILFSFCYFFGSSNIITSKQTCFFNGVQIENLAPPLIMSK